MKTTLFFLLLICSMAVYGQESHSEEIQKFQDALNEEFLNPDESPLTKKERRKFKGHNFFAADENYHITAEFIRAGDPKTFQMKTTTSRLSTYDIYGVARFTLDGNAYELTIYQSHTLRQTEEYRDYLFLPFTDLTNGEETYGGGRYIDLTIPSGDTIIIDFNKAYSPSCAYNYGYSCPIPPVENHMDTRIEAGVKNLEL